MHRPTVGSLGGKAVSHERSTHVSATRGRSTGVWASKPVAEVEDARVGDGLLVLVVRATHRVREHQEPADRAFDRHRVAVADRGLELRLERLQMKTQPCSRIGLL